MRNENEKSIFQFPKLILKFSMIKLFHWGIFYSILHWWIMNKLLILFCCFNRPTSPWIWFTKEITWWHKKERILRFLINFFKNFQVFKIFTKITLIGGFLCEKSVAESWKRLSDPDSGKRYLYWNSCIAFLKFYQLFRVLSIFLNFFKFFRFFPTFFIL